MNLAQVACGRLDVYFEVRATMPFNTAVTSSARFPSLPAKHNRTRSITGAPTIWRAAKQDGYGGPWDVAAGKVLVEVRAELCHSLDAYGKRNRSRLVTVK